MKVVFYFLWICSSCALADGQYKLAAVGGIFMIGVAIMHLADKKKKQEDEPE
jgi:hypothetical protein